MQLIEPHGGSLKVAYLPGEQVAEARQEALRWPSVDLNQRQLCDVKLLLNGAFSPLHGFLGQADYERVLAEMRLADGTLWPIPVTLDVTDEFADTLEVGGGLALRDPEGFVVALLRVDSIWRPDRQHEALAVFGTSDDSHPGVDHLLHQTKPCYVGGTLSGIARPIEYDFKPLRDDPKDLREKFARWGWSRVVAFQTRNPMHRAHQELTRRAAQRAEANLLLHPVVGITKPGDVDHFSRVRCYEHVLKTYPEQTTTLSLLPLAMRMAGPREAVWHAIIRKNYGCTPFHRRARPRRPGAAIAAASRSTSPTRRRSCCARSRPSSASRWCRSRRWSTSRSARSTSPRDEVEPGETMLDISGTEFRRRLQAGIGVPEWFSFEPVVTELRKRYPPRHRQGFTVLFTGLSGAGKSTLANALMIKLMELGGRSVTLLDGDLVRKHLSSELGFSMEHRNLNVLRIGYVASEITKAGGVALCAPIAPYAIIRRRVREMVESYGAFLEVYVSTPLAVCETRDFKGLYAKARAGLIKQVTGIDDPYEVPGSRTSRSTPKPTRPTRRRSSSS